MDRRNKLKIIFGLENSRLEQDAIRIINGLERDRLRSPHRAIPMGVPFHATLYPKLCEDCERTYWSKDEWGVHLGCKGIPEKKTGF